jgi:hypothetical protein
MDINRQIWTHTGLRAPALLLPTPRPPGTDRAEGKLEIAVFFTSPEATVAAIGRAAALLKGLNGRISLIAAQTVPYPLALDNPPVPFAFNKQRLLEIAGKSPVQMTVHLCVCRSRSEMLMTLLKPGSVVVIGGRKTWWPTWEKKLAEELRRSGLDVVLLEVNGKSG